jgi:hypothetical protein
MASRRSLSTTNRSARYSRPRRHGGGATRRTPTREGRRRDGKATLVAVLLLIGVLIAIALL